MHHYKYMVEDLERPRYWQGFSTTELLRLSVLNVLVHLCLEGIRRYRVRKISKGHLDPFQEASEPHLAQGIPSL